MANKNLVRAKVAKNDEFYTQYSDIQNEVNAYIVFDEHIFRDKTILLPCDDPEWSNFTKFFINNFELFGIKKLISTSYAPNSKPKEIIYQPTLFETINPQFDKEKTQTKGKIFILSRDENKDGIIDEKDLQWNYLEGDGDFRSDEVKHLRDEADIIITNPPFSLFREFTAWLIESKKQFSIIGNMNAITYKEIFPYLKNNTFWLGNGFSAGNAYFGLPQNAKTNYVQGVLQENGLVKFRNCCWYTNIEHGKRHTKLPLMTKEQNIKFSKHKEIKESGYQQYDNYNAIEVPFFDAIPSDYTGVMGVPISFLDKYNPEQFDILGATQRGCHNEVPDTKKYDDYWECKPNGEKTGSSGGKTNENANLLQNDGKKNYFINADGRIIQSAYQRLFIKHKEK